MTESKNLDESVLSIITIAASTGDMFHCTFCPKNLYKGYLGNTWLNTLLSYLCNTSQIRGIFK